MNFFFYEGTLQSATDYSTYYCTQFYTCVVVTIVIQDMLDLVIPLTNNCRNLSSRHEKCSESI